MSEDENEITRECRELFEKHSGQTASLGELLARDRALSYSVEGLSKKVSDLGAQLDRLALMGAKIHELENRPELKHRGVWRETENYRECNMVSHAGGLWIARADTKARPGQSHEWQLIVKSGKVGRGE